MSFLESIKAIFAALRSLFKSRRTLAVLLVAYGGLIAIVYQFVSTREATISQLVWTLILVLLAPACFFLLQAVSINYASGPEPGNVLRRTFKDCLKLGAVSVPLILLIVATLYGLNKIETATITVTTIRYFLIGVVAPLFAIQLWIASSSAGLRSLLGRLKEILIKTLAPQSMFVYACGFLIFAIVPYFLLTKPIVSERAWLEFSFLVIRLSVSGLLILVGWVTTVGALSILSRKSYAPLVKE